MWSPHIQYILLFCNGPVVPNRFFEFQGTETHSQHPKKVNYQKDICELAPGPEKLLRTKTS